MIQTVSLGTSLAKAFLIAICLLFISPAWAEEDAVTVRVFSLPSNRDQSPSRVADYRVMLRFLELFPHIRLESSTSLQIEGASMDAAPLMAIAGGTSPDIIYVNFRQSDTYIQQGFLYPLDEYIAQMTPEELAERVPSNIMPVIHRKGPEEETHYWALPQEILAMVLFCRKDLFAQAGLDPDKPPKDWQEFREYAERMANPATRRYGTMFHVGPDASYTIFPFLSSAGAEAITQGPDGTWRASFNSPQAVEAFSFVNELMRATVTRDGKTGSIAYRGTDATTMAAEGRIAMYMGSLGGQELARFNPDLITAAPVPRGPTGISSGIVNARMLGIFAGVKDRRVRDAAWEYIRFVGSPEARRVYTDTMVELGAARLVNPLWLEEFGYRELAQLSPPGLAEVFRNAVKNATPEPYGHNAQFIYNYVSRPMERLAHMDLAGFSPEERNARIQALLDEAVEETNERMLGMLSPEERAKRNLVGWIVAVVAMGAFAFFIGLVFKWMSQGIPSSGGGDARRSLLAAVFILPALLLVVVWQYYPLARGSLMAFQDYRIMGGSQWIGISNFADVIFDGRFWLSLKNAFYFCALWLLLGFCPPVILAVLLQEIPVAKGLYRVLFYMPALVSGVVILFMWRGIFDPSPDGVLNRLIGFLGISPQTWLLDPALAMLCIVFPLSWANLGPASIIYLAALKGIPDELYEAADIDGAGFMGKIYGIVLPYLRPLLIINVVGATIFGFKSGDAVLAMTGGGPNLATQVVGYEIWQRTFLYLQFGQGTAMAWILGLILMAFTAYQMRILARVEFRTANR